MSKKVSARDSILHLTHTDLRFDSRIRREILSLLDIENIMINALGVKQKSIDEVGYAFDQFNYKNLELFLSLLRKYKSVYYFFFNIELIVRFFLQGVRYKPSIVHCHDTMVLPAGLLFKFIFKSKLIYDAHELESKKTAQSKFLSFITLFIEKIAWNKIDVLISVSNSILNWYQENLGVKKSFLILNAPSNTNNVNSKFKQAYLRNIYSIDDEHKIFLYLGDFTIGRNIETILRYLLN